MKYPIAKILVLFLIVFTFKNAQAWGFWGHQRINRIAVFLLPPAMIDFYKANIEYITVHAVDPDKRRYALPDEGARHFIDLDHYCQYPCDSFPRRWKDAVAKYSEDTLKAYGIVPWHIQTMMYRLTDAFKMKDKNKILKTSTELGHYIADASVPLHTTENYNGQMTNQVGIHGFWESRIPELFGEDYDYFIGKAEYIDKPLDYTWKIVLQSHAALDTVFGMEKKLSATFPDDIKYTYESRGATMVRVYSKEFSQAYSDSMQKMVERRMRSAIKSVADIWYTCWINAGQPVLNEAKELPLSEEERKEMEEEDRLWRTKPKPMFGHFHPESGTE
ncbi:MAG TPA: zinc dependent phospholipase C family protein [Chitinophagales bacterium]|nr:zinc dependent phospholipase C family protein [Chitinophagales bacterium]